MTLQPCLSSNLPLWIPVYVSYNFLVISPGSLWLITISLSSYFNVPTGEITAAVPEPNTSVNSPLS